METIGIPKTQLEVLATKRPLITEVRVAALRWKPHQIMLEAMLYFVKVAVKVLYFDSQAFYAAAPSHARSCKWTEHTSSSFG